ncbi:hypothetical protein [Ammoniphilus sp. 3BR4]|uniref:hypothetical protein n=1 Tax=Ammoniphilus sp. 3BR4 TaxID=3158265 RepID=UPI0034658B77
MPMSCRIVCSNELVFQDICDQLNLLQVLYLKEVERLEICVKRDPEYVSKFLLENGFEAHVLVHT